MRNVKEIAVAVQHTFALTNDGRLYAWGTNPKGMLGVGHAWELCEGPELVTSLADKTITHITTGYYFAVAVTSTGDLYCAGDNDNLECPVPKGSPVNAFVKLPFPELAGNVKTAAAGMFHTLVQTKDGKVYAFGRGRDGQLGPGPTTNGFRAIPEMNDAVALSAGTWHSAALKADGSVWVWGNNSKSQLCDGTTTNRAAPLKVNLPGGAKASDVFTGGWATVIRTMDGALYACGDNQSGMLGVDKQVVVAQLTQIPVPASPATRFSMGGAHAAVSTDGCNVRLAGWSSDGMVTDNDGTESAQRTFVQRPNLNLCAPKPAAPLPTLVREYPKGGEAGCWTPRVQEDAARNPKYAGQVSAMIAAEGILKKSAAFMAPPLPSRFRTSLSAGPYDESGARMHIKIVPERKHDLTRLWTGACDVIPQVDRIGGAIFQISIFLNSPLDSASGDPPKLTGRVGAYPEYDHWIYISKDGQLPWVPQTVADRLGVVGEKRERALAEFNREQANYKPIDLTAMQASYEMMKKSDPAGADKFLESIKQTAEEQRRRQQVVMPARRAQLEKELADYRKYRASLTAEQLASPAVAGDPTGQLKRESDATAAKLRELTPDEQKQIDQWTTEGRALERQAQEETRNRNADAAARLRAQSNEIAQKSRALRAAHLERIEPDMQDLTAQYELVSVKPGPAEQAIKVKKNPAFPNMADPNRVQLITVVFSEDPVRNERTAWQQSIKETFDFAALAALIK
jgi:hypothetical protein